ncbi:MULTISPECIES: co-chaperone YbbN [unclassified Anaerococcus]|uniref:thioredoxin TrxA n=1 Tax=unclassified Anaerococcus TaxID=2614126 RepID=UPI001CEDCC98|nr:MULTISPECIES: thioredoxin domain-containing protein [unclassified Anaerococcus]
MMISLDKKTFEPEVNEYEGKVFVDFWSESCVPCMALKPFVDSLAEEYEGKMKFCDLNITKARRVAIKQGVLGLPTMIVYNNGEKIAELHEDECTEENIRKIVEENL